MREEYSEHGSWLKHIHHLIGCGALVLVGYYFFAVSDASFSDYRFYLALGACCLIHDAFHKGRQKLVERSLRD